MKDYDEIDQNKYLVKYTFSNVMLFVMWRR